jgi:hypothetical protein
MVQENGPEQGPKQRMAGRWRMVGAALLALAVLAALWLGWSAWLAPTRVALVNYPDFQAARIIQTSPGAFAGAAQRPRSGVWPRAQAR